MSELQQQHYEGADEVASDPWHLLDRDNRNHRKKRHIIEDTTAATPNDRVLEVGCGNGLHARKYAERYDYTGVDLVQSLVDATDRNTPPDATVLQADATALPHDANTFDAVVGTAVLHHMDDYVEALREWQRVARPGGSVTLMEPNYLFPKEALSTHLIQAERHKINMRPWRIRKLVRKAAIRNAAWTVAPRIYTPPWPSALTNVYDGIDNTTRRLPLLRWMSQMLLIDIRIPES